MVYCEQLGTNRQRGVISRASEIWYRRMSPITARPGTRIALRTECPRFPGGGVHAIYQFLEVYRGRMGGSHENDIDARLERSPERADRFAEPPLRSDAANGATEAFRSGEADPCRARSPRSQRVRDHRVRRGPAARGVGSPEIRG